MGFLESSEEETLTPVCCVPRSNSPNFIVFVCVCVCVCVCVRARVRVLTQPCVCPRACARMLTQPCPLLIYKMARGTVDL